MDVILGDGQVAGGLVSDDAVEVEACFGSARLAASQETARITNSTQVVGLQLLSLTIASVKPKHCKTPESISRDKMVVVAPVIKDSQEVSLATWVFSLVQCMRNKHRWRISATVSYTHLTLPTKA